MTIAFHPRAVVAAALCSAIVATASLAQTREQRVQKCIDVASASQTASDDAVVANCEQLNKPRLVIAGGPALEDGAEVLIESEGMKWSEGILDGQAAIVGNFDAPTQESARFTLTIVDEEKGIVRLSRRGRYVSRKSYWGAFSDRRLSIYVFIPDGPNAYGDFKVANVGNGLVTLNEGGAWISRFCCSPGTASTNAIVASFHGQAATGMYVRITRAPSPLLRFNYVDESTKPGGAYNPSAAPNSWISDVSKRWMGSLPDDMPVRSLSIPGTHDTAARFGGLPAETQSWDIGEQLAAGIRYLDLRTRRVGDSLTMHHGAVYLNQNFDDVLKTLSYFLAGHPSETIVVRVRANETSASSDAQDMATIWASYMTKYPNLFAQSTSSNPSLGSLRGKVFLMYEGFNDSARGIRYKGGDFTYQDRYNVYFLDGDGLDGAGDAANLPGKKKVVKEYLDKAATETNWVLNYLSGATHMAASDVARAVNPVAYDHIGEHKGRKKLGIVIMDFPGEQLIYRIIKSNFDKP